jgi:hypothetical protein
MSVDNSLPGNIHLKLVCSDLGSMTMEQWVLFVVVISPAVLFDVDVPHKAAQLWKPLRQGLLYFMSYRKGQHRPELWNTARNHLLQYARLVEEITGGKHLCTVQLHSAVVHLVDYVELYGPAAYRAEFWVERMVQVCCRRTPLVSEHLCIVRL